MNPPKSKTARLRLIGLVLLPAGVVVCAICCVGLAIDREQFFRSWLIGFLFWWTLSMGSLGLALIHNLSGGQWGWPIRPFLHAGILTLLPAALCFLPLAFGLRELYVWANPEQVAADPLLAHKAAYLNVPFFLGRAAGYFTIWMLCGGFVIAAQSGMHRRGGGATLLRTLSGLALVATILTTTFAAIDWAMSLEPKWYSTIYGGLFAASSALAAMAMAIVCVVAFRPGSVRPPERGDHHKPPVQGDLGNLLLALLMVWTYFAFSQYLITWAGNLPEEITWYVKRLEGGWLGWQTVAAVVLIGHFIIPFLLLISRDVKRSPRWLPLLAGWLLLMHLVDIFWTVAPAFYGSRIFIHWMDPLAVIGLGGLWMGTYLLASSLGWLGAGRPAEEPAETKHERARAGEQPA